MGDTSGEFGHRRLPSIVWFVYQCSGVHELQFCWESLHKLLFYAGAMADNALPLEVERWKLSPEVHASRSGEDNWSPTSPMLDWLGVTLRGGSNMSDADRQALCQPEENPLAA